MIEQTSIPLSETFVQFHGNIQETRNELLIQELMDNKAAVEKMLSGYYYESRGNIYDLKLKKESIVFEHQLKGHLTFNFSIHYFMGCQDLTYDDTNTMRIDFEILIPEKTIRLRGEDIREREPDTY